MHDEVEKLQNEFERRFDPWWTPKALWFMFSGAAKRNLNKQRVLLDDSRSLTKNMKKNKKRLKKLAKFHAKVDEYTELLKRTGKDHSRGEVMSNKSKNCIVVTYHGGKEEMSFAMWADWTIQDSQAALDIADTMSETEEYEDNVDSALYYSTYRITNKAEFDKQMKKYRKEYE